MAQRDRQQQHRAPVVGERVVGRRPATQRALQHALQVRDAARRILGPQGLERAPARLGEPPRTEADGVRQEPALARRQPARARRPIGDRGRFRAQRGRAPALRRPAAQAERALHLLAREPGVVDRTGGDLAQPARQLELTRLELGAVHTLVREQQTFQPPPPAQRRHQSHSRCDQRRNLSCQLGEALEVAAQHRTREARKQRHHLAAPRHSDAAHPVETVPAHSQRGE